MPEPEILIGAQSFTFEIHNQPDGRFAVLIFFTLPNAAANPENKILAKLAIPYDGFVAMPSLIEDVIKRNNEQFGSPNK